MKILKHWRLYLMCTGVGLSLAFIMWMVLGFGAINEWLVLVVGLVAGVLTIWAHNVIFPAYKVALFPLVQKDW